MYVKNKFKIGERVKGPGVCGVVVAIVGPYSVTVKQDRDGKPLVTTTLDVEKETD